MRSRAAGRGVLALRLYVRLHRLVRLEVDARNERQKPRGDRTAVENVSTNATAPSGGACARRLAATLGHEQPDRIPIDLGGTAVTGRRLSGAGQTTLFIELDVPNTAGDYLLQAKAEAGKGKPVLSRRRVTIALPSRP